MKTSHLASFIFFQIEHKIIQNKQLNNLDNFKHFKILNL